MARHASTRFPTGSTKPGAAAPPPGVAPDAEGLGAAAGTVSVWTLASRLLGIVREQVIAALFGAGNAADAFNIAFRIPNLLRDLFAEGALSAAFVPTFTQAAEKRGRDDAFRLGAQLMAMLVLVLGAVIVVGWIAAPLLVRLMAPGFADVPGKLELTTALARTMLPFLLFVALAAAAMGMLNALRRFGPGAAAPVWFNVGSIAVTLALVPVFAARGVPTVHALAFGVLVGGLLQFLAQLPALWQAGFRPAWPRGFDHPGLRRVAVLVAPAAIGLSATQVNVVINSWFASTLGTGAVSWLAYAFRVLFVPIGLFGVALGTVSMTAYSRAASREDAASLKDVLGRAVRLNAALTLPAAFGLAALALPVTALLYEHGRFTAFDTEQTAHALVAYVVGLAAYSGVKVVVPAFYALGDTRSPLIASFLAVAFNFALNLALIGPLGHAGLALATGLTSIFNFVQLWWWLGRKIGPLGAGPVLRAAGRAALVSLLVGGALFAGVMLSEPLWRRSLLGQAVCVLLGVAIGAGLTLALYRVFGVSERTEIWAALNGVLRRRRRPRAQPPAA